jgi:hypothetical protein
MQTAISANRLTLKHCRITALSNCHIAKKGFAQSQNAGLYPAF